MKYQIIGLIILLLQFVIITWDGIKNKGVTRKRWTGITKVAFTLIGPIDLIAVIYGRSMNGYNGKVAGVIMCIIGLIFIYYFLIDRNRPGGPKRFLNQISRNPMYFGLIMIYLGIMIMFMNWLLIIWTALTLTVIFIQVLDEEKKMKVAAPQAFKIYKKRVFRFFGIKRWWFVLGVVVILSISLLLKNSLDNRKTEKLSSMSFKEAVQYYTHGTSEVRLTVGTIDNGEIKYTVYGRNSKKLDRKSYTYDMGSATKIITAALVNKAIAEGKMKLDDEISAYIELPANNFYPTLQELLSHTSGYKSFYFEPNMIFNGLVDRNIYQGIKSDRIINRARTRSLPMAAYDFKYSNYGYALLGALLEKVYDTNYTKLVNEYAKEQGLKNTGIGNTNDDLRRYTTWSENDAYLSSNGVRTDIEDMLKLINTIMNDPNYAGMYQSVRVINQENALNNKYNIHMDEIGMSWVIDNTNSFIWNNGATDNYNMYIGFSPSTKKAVIIMSNMPSSYRTSTTVMGIKCLKRMTKAKAQ